MSAGSNSRLAACTLHPRCFPSPIACDYYCPHVHAMLGWYPLIQQPFSALSRYRCLTISVEWYHHFGIQNTQAWQNHPIQPSLLALELATSCPPLDHICQAPPPEPCSPAPNSHNARLAAGLGGPEVLLHYTCWQGVTYVVLAADAAFHVGTVGSWWRGTQGMLAGVQKGQPQP